MSRLMAVSLTEAQVRARTKTVTRRLGWLFLKPGDRLTLVRKSMGRRRADGTVEPLERIVDVEIVSVTREKLTHISTGEVRREGFPDMTPGDFIAFFSSTHKGCTPDTEVTRIEWRYLDTDLAAPFTCLCGTTVQWSRGADHHRLVLDLDGTLHNCPEKRAKA